MLSPSSPQNLPPHVLHYLIHSFLSNPVIKQEEVIKIVKQQLPESTIKPHELLKTLSTSLHSPFNLSIKCIPSHNEEEGNLWILVSDKADKISKSASSLKEDEVKEISKTRYYSITMDEFITKSDSLFSSEYENTLLPSLIKDGWFGYTTSSQYSIGERIVAELEPLLVDLFPYSCFICKARIFTNQSVMCDLCPRRDDRLTIHQNCLCNLNTLELRCPKDTNHQFKPVPFESLIE